MEMKKVAADDRRAMLLADQPLRNSVGLSQDVAVDGDGAQNGREERRKGIAPASLDRAGFALIPGEQALYTSANRARAAYERHRRRACFGSASDAKA